MKKRGVLICLIGIDGSGKTTLTKELIKDLRQNGIDAEYRWGKFESSLLKFVIFIKNKLFVREKDWKKNYHKSLEIKKNVFNNTLVSWLYEYFVLLSYIFQIVFKIVIPLKLGKSIICDRYVYDTVVDLAQDLGYSDEKIEYRLNQLFSLLPYPDALFFIDVPEEISLKRKNDIPSLVFLRRKKETYSKIREYLKANDTSVTVMDGTNSINNLKKEALAVIGN